jgi:DNA invertase Pin-like site-specific DNA recombinase
VSIRKPLIYTRYSSDLQSEKSNDDQEREVRALLRRVGIDDADAIVIHDRAESGTKNDRPGFLRALGEIKQDLVSVVCVDDQSRMSRNDDVIGVIKDIVYHGCRFITGDGIDTNENGWQLKVRLLGIHNATSTEETARRVRRGMRGRVLENKSAGDIPYGYQSHFDDPEYAANYCGRGPKPTKSIKIDEPQAQWVRLVFQMVAEGTSFNAVARRLQELKASVGRNVKKWSPTLIARMVRNRKYTGEEWTWGATTIIRDSQGRKKQVAVPVDEVTCVRRPELRIVDSDTWARVQARIASIEAIFGFRVGQKKRGPKVHFSQVYPRDVLFKLLRCGCCGGEMHYNRSRQHLYRQCKNTGKGPDDCREKTRVPAEETRRVLTCFVADLLRAVPDWLSEAIAAMNDFVRKQQTQLPVRVAALRQQQADLTARRERIFELVEAGRLDSLNHKDRLGTDGGSVPSSVRQRIEELDHEVAQIEARIVAAEEQLESATQLPDRNFMVDQIQQLPSALLADESKASLLLGQLFDEVRVFRVIPPGKQRGYHLLKFRLKAWRVLHAAMNGHISERLASCISDNDGDGQCQSPEFCLNVGGPTRADEAASQVVKLRQEGATWDEIRAETGLSRNTVRECFHRSIRVLDSQVTTIDLDNERRVGNCDGEADVA